MMFVRIDGPNGISYSTSDSPEKVGEWMLRMYLEIQRLCPRSSVRVEILAVTKEHD